MVGLVHYSPNLRQMLYPSFEELRMLLVIVDFAGVEAARSGDYRASFHGFRVHACRLDPAPFDTVPRVVVEVYCGAVMLDRSIVDVPVS